jgi:hypothetical protein
MKVLYRSSGNIEIDGNILNFESTYIISLDDKNKVYYGDGKNTNSIGFFGPLQFLRFDPYLEYVGDQEVEIPENIIRFIENYKNAIAF